MSSDFDAPAQVPSRRGTLVVMGLVLIATVGLFAFRLDSEPLFVDEAAFLSQSYFGDLYVSGRHDSPLWLEYPAYDLPPLPKYLINVSLRLNGIARPGREWMIRWYQSTNEKRFVTPENLRAARWPSILLGAIGCLGLTIIGTITADRRVGCFAAIMLAINPLYMLHARRAMADVPAESFVLLTLAVGLLLIRQLAAKKRLQRRILPLSLVVGTLGGLAVSTKLNGGLALMIVGAWALAVLFGDLKVRHGWATCVLSLVLVGISSLVVFVALNPFVTASPSNLGKMPLLAAKPMHQSMIYRLFEVVEHRNSVSANAAQQFPKDALMSLPEKLSALAIQGYGRFGPFGPRRSDSTKRYDAAQDWGAVIWLPLVIAGFLRFTCFGSTRKSKAAPSLGWTVPLAYLVTLATVGLFLPLAWDRYFLPIQSGSCLLAASAVVGFFDFLRSRQVKP